MSFSERDLLEAVLGVEGVRTARASESAMHPGRRVADARAGPRSKASDFGSSSRQLGRQEMLAELMSDSSEEDSKLQISQDSGPRSRQRAVHRPRTPPEDSESEEEAAFRDFARSTVLDLSHSSLLSDGEKILRASTIAHPANAPRNILQRPVSAGARLSPGKSTRWMDNSNINRKAAGGKPGARTEGTTSSTDEDILRAALRLSPNKGDFSPHGPSPPGKPQAAHSPSKQQAARSAIQRAAAAWARQEDDTPSPPRGVVSPPRASPGRHSPGRTGGHMVARALGFALAETRGEADLTDEQRAAEALRRSRSNRPAPVTRPPVWHSPHKGVAGRPLGSYMLPPDFDPGEGLDLAGRGGSHAAYASSRDASDIGLPIYHVTVPALPSPTRIPVPALLSAPSPTWSCILIPNP